MKDGLVPTAHAATQKCYKVYEYKAAVPSSNTATLNVGNLNANGYINAGSLSSGDIDLTSPKWSNTSAEISPTGGKVLGMDGYREEWVGCPDGYFMTAFRFGRQDLTLVPIFKCSKL